MKIKQVITVLTVLLGIVLLSSCDFLLPAPLGRDNPEDSGAQINAFGSFYAGNDTAELIWNWRSFTGTDPSREIVKVRIVHKENDPPSSMYPLDKNDVKEFTTDGSAVWEKLKEYNEHYFALYRMEKSGTWLSPLYSKIHIEGAGTQDQLGSPPLSFMFISKTPGSQVQSTFIDLTQTTRWFVSVDTTGLDNQDYVTGKIQKAVLDIPSAAVNMNGFVHVVPMYRDVQIGDLWDDISDASNYDMENSILMQIDFSDNLKNIASVLDRCRVYNTSTFALIVPSGDSGELKDSSQITLNSVAIWRAQ